MKYDIFNLFPLLNFLNNKIETIIKLNIKNTKMNKLFTSFIHFYSLILLNFQKLDFSQENLSNYKQIQIFNSGKINYLFFLINSSINQINQLITSKYYF